VFFSVRFGGIFCFSIRISEQNKILHSVSLYPKIILFICNFCHFPIFLISIFFFRTNRILLSVQNFRRKKIYRMR